MLPSLLGQIDPHEALLSVSGDGAYDTKACHEAIALRAAQAIIPVRKNARKTWKENRPGARARNEILRATQRLGRDIWGPFRIRKKSYGKPHHLPARHGVTLAVSG